VTHSIGLIPSLNVCKPDSFKNSILLEACQKKETCSFREAFMNAAAKIAADKTQKQVSHYKSNITDTAEKMNGEQKACKDEKVEELQEKLEELAGMSNGEVLTGDMQTLLESIKKILKELMDEQPGSVVQEAAGAYEKISELALMLEGSQSTRNLSNKIEMIVSQIQDEIRTAFETDKSSHTAAEAELANDIIIVEDITQEKNTDIDDSPKEVAEKKAPKTESIASKEPVEKQNTAAAEKTHKYFSEKAHKENKAEAASEEESIKDGLGGKIDKVTVKDSTVKEKYTQKDGSRKEAAEATYEPINNHNKMPDSKEAAVRQEQNIMLDKVAEIQNQAAAVKAKPPGRVEIISQIVKKAEVIITGAQSEMNIQLEPENLGRLTLKIAVERGVITAKFTAESNEVKQAIESSFNELKDMLQEKGLEIQNLTVSVGHNSKEYDFNRNSELWSGKPKSGARISEQALYNGYLEGGVSAARLNPYVIHTGEFDQRA
jgi:flagellar hook-length control protein FliK